MVSVMFIVKPCSLFSPGRNWWQQSIRETHVLRIQGVYKRNIDRLIDFNPLSSFLLTNKSVINELEYRMYADDTSITFASNDVEEINECINSDLEEIRVSINSL